MHSILHISTVTYSRTQTGNTPIAMRPSSPLLGARAARALRAKADMVGFDVRRPKERLTFTLYY